MFDKALQPLIGTSFSPIMTFGYIYTDFSHIPITPIIMDSRPLVRRRKTARGAIYHTTCTVHRHLWA